MGNEKVLMMALSRVILGLLSSSDSRTSHPLRFCFALSLSLSLCIPLKLNSLAGGQNIVTPFLFNLSSFLEN